MEISTCRCLWYSQKSSTIVIILLLLAEEECLLSKGECGAGPLGWNGGTFSTSASVCILTYDKEYFLRYLETLRISRTLVTQRRIKV